MKVILTRDVSELGKKGDVVDVAEGYARNYLVPRSMAVIMENAISPSVPSFVIELAR